MLHFDVRPADLWYLLLGDGEPHLAAARVQLFHGQVLLLHHGQRCIMGELGEHLVDVRTPLVQEVPPLSALLLFLHLLQFR